MKIRHSLILVFATLLFVRSAAAEDSTIEGASTTHGWVEVSDGYRLRSYLTRPLGAARKLPLVYFVQWLSCDTIEISDGNDGWTQMLRGVAQGGDYLFARIDKAGVGASEGGPCSELDNETELRHHREALTQLMVRDDVDSDRVVVFGASMGSTMAPLLANSHDVAGVAAWGGGAVTWLERLMAFDRNALEYGGGDPAIVADTMAANVAFYKEYLLDQKTPGEIIAANPEMKAIVDGIIGLSESDHYGRPHAFHQQAQQQNWQAAWSNVDVPVFIGFGEFDWIESVRGHRTIVIVVNDGSPGQAELHVIPGMNHHFSIFDSAEAAFEDETGVANASPFLDEFLRWLRTVTAN